MKILYVYGDDDYAALTFDDDMKLNNPADLKRLYEASFEAGLVDDHTYSEIIIDEDAGIYCQALEFNSVDPNFIKWIKYEAEFLDYDESKHRDFYIVEE